MIKRILSLSLCLLMLFLFSACKSRGAEANLCFPIDNDPLFLDPQVISDTGAKNIIANCFEGLVTLDSEGAIAPGCAESWSVSSDGLTYTFNLRKNAKWLGLNSSSDFLGENYKKSFDFRVTAHDFVFGLQRAVKPETLSPGAKNLLSIENAALVNSGKVPADSLGVKAVNDYTLTIKLTQADPDFLYVLLEPECMPCNETFFEATGGRYGLSIRFLMYNGPFYIINWADDSSVSLSSNHEYYDYKNVKPSSVYYSINNEQSSRPDKIKDEIYDVAPLTAEQAQELSQKRGYEVKTFESGIYGFLFNCKDSTLSNLNIRKAIAHSFDPSTLSDGTQNIAAKGIIPSSMLISGTKYRDKAGALTLTNENKTAAAYLEAGLKQLGTDSVSVTILCTEEKETAVRRALQHWQATLGVKFSIFVEIAAQADIDKRLSEDGDWQIALTDISFPNLTAFNGLLQFTSDNSANIVGYADSKYDKLVSAVKTTSGIDGTITALKQAEQHLLDSCVIIPLYDYPIYYGIGKNVENIIFNTTGEILYFKNTLVK